jgi:hypothetical protein
MDRGAARNGRRTVTSQPPDFNHCRSRC